MPKLTVEIIQQVTPDYLIDTCRYSELKTSRKPFALKC